MYWPIKKKTGFIKYLWLEDPRYRRHQRVPVRTELSHYSLPLCGERYRHLYHLWHSVHWEGHRGCDWREEVSNRVAIFLLWNIFVQNFCLLFFVEIVLTRWSPLLFSKKAMYFQFTMGLSGLSANYRSVVATSKWSKCLKKSSETISQTSWTRPMNFIWIDMVLIGRSFLNQRQIHQS